MITIVFGIFRHNCLIDDRIVEYVIEDENVKTFIEFVLNEGFKISRDYNEPVHVNILNLTYQKKKGVKN